MAWLSTASFSPFSSLVGPYVAASPLSSPASPGWVLLDKTARISAFRNVTAAACDTGEGQAVEASFWLVDPPGVSYFSVHCPGLGEDDFSGEPVVVCAAAAFVLFRVTLSVSRLGQGGSTYHFVYAARDAAGKPSLQLLPAPPRPHAQLGLLPCGSDHYAVAFLDSEWTARGEAWHYHAYIFSTKTQAWSKKAAAASSELSDSDRPLLRASKQITVGASSLGWVDTSHGITLLCDLLHECPVVKHIPFPAPPPPSKALLPAECFCDVACCDDLIKFVQVKFDEPGGCRIKGKRWRATTWTRKISSNNWRVRTTVDVADISVDPRYSALLPELWDDVNQELELKKMVFLGPILGIGNNDLLYVMAQVDEEDIKAWVIVVDMRSAAVEGLAPVLTKRYSPNALFSPCAFPGYLNNTTQGPDMGNPVDKYFKSAVDQRWFRQLDQWLDSQDSTCFECRRLLRYCCPASALRFDIQVVVKYASYNGHCQAASKAVDFCVRALDDIYEVLQESPLSDPSTTAMKSQIGVALEALDSILEFVPLAHMPRRVQMMLADVCLKREEQVLVFDKACHHAKGRSGEQQQAGNPTPATPGRLRRKRRRKTRKRSSSSSSSRSRFWVADRRYSRRICCILLAAYWSRSLSKRCAAISVQCGRAGIFSAAFAR